MGLFSRSSDNSSQDLPLFETHYVGLWVKVYKNRVEWNAPKGRQSVPLGQISGVQQARTGIFKISLETSGGNTYDIPTKQKRELQEAIYDAQNANSTPTTRGQASSTADELKKFADLKEQGVITNEEFDAKKKELLG